MDITAEYLNKRWSFALYFTRKILILSYHGDYGFTKSIQFEHSCRFVTHFSFTISYTRCQLTVKMLITKDELTEIYLLRSFNIMKLGNKLVGLINDLSALTSV